MMKRNFVPLSFIGVIALSTPFHAGADFSYHAELPKDSQVSTDYLEKRKALQGAAHDAESWQRQIDEEKARIDADVARDEKEKQLKCQRQEHQPRPRVDNASNSYLTPDPCAAKIRVNIPVY